MTESNTSKNKFPTKKKLEDDSGLSKNHSKSVRYRLRVQQDKEAEEELKEFVDDNLRAD